MFVKTHGVIVLDLSGVQAMGIVWTDNMRLEYTFDGPMEEIIALFSLNQFQNYWKIILDGCT
jgi:hypothetical protein